VKNLGLDNGRLSNPVLRTDIARFEIDEVCHQLTMERARDEAKAGASLGPAASMFKYYGTELNKRRQELLMSVGSHDSLVWEGAQSNDGRLPRRWLRSKGNSIEGGTSEIQLNIVAKRILGLPG
jgi:acyl-CoA dehydrogenase